jgi:hypothetical protein
MLLPEVIRGDDRAAETRSARLPLSASRYLLQNTPFSAVPNQPETASEIPHERGTSGASAVWR